MHPENKLVLSEFENTVFKNSILYKAIKDAKNINNEEVLYFSKNKKFLMPTNQFKFLVFYPCVDVSDNFKEGYVNLQRTVEISAGEISGEKT